MSDTYCDYQQDPEKAFSLSLVDLKHGVRVNVEIQDQEGNKFPIPQIVEGLIKYMENELKKDTNIIVSQVLPVLSQVLVSGLTRSIGISAADFMLNNELIKDSMLQSMTLAFLFLKFIEQKNLKMVTIIEPLGDSEKNLLAQRSERIQEQSTLSGFIGMRPKDILRELYKSGELSATDLNNFLEERDNDSKNESKN